MFFVFVSVVLVFFILINEVFDLLVFNSNNVFLCIRILDLVLSRWGVDVGFKLFVDLFEFKLGVLWCFVLRNEKWDDGRDVVFFSIVEVLSCMLFSSSDF